MTFAQLLSASVALEAMAQYHDGVLDSDHIATLLEFVNANEQHISRRDLVQYLKAVCISHENQRVEKILIALTEER